MLLTQSSAWVSTRSSISGSYPAGCGVFVLQRFGHLQQFAQHMAAFQYGFLQAFLDGQAGNHLGLGLLHQHIHQRQHADHEALSCTSRRCG
jgi:hypothetical protein